MQQFFKTIYQYISPPESPDIEPAVSRWQAHLPTLWLLGKTGAGKSSLIQSLTGNTTIEIGNGFQPCTPTSMSYIYPQSNPLLCFLDTRGLSEADYDPREDIAACQNRSHALLVVMKAEEPEQSDIIKALEQIRDTGQIKQVLVVHTGVMSIANAEERKNAIAYNQSQVERAWKGELASVAVDFAHTPELAGLDVLKSSLGEMLPILFLLMEEEEHHNREEANFSKLKREVIWYAGIAGASDAIPVVGLVSVPAIQGKMLHSLASHYGIEWNWQRFSEFAGLLGSSFAFQYVSKLGLRQLVKIIPVYGQTIGSASAVAISFGSTYGVGRAACMYLYHLNKGEPVSSQDIRQAFEQAFTHTKERHEKSTRRD